MPMMSPLNFKTCLSLSTSRRYGSSKIHPTQRNTQNLTCPSQPGNYINEITESKAGHSRKKSCLFIRIPPQEVASTESKQQIKTWAQGAASHTIYRYNFVVMKMMHHCSSDTSTAQFCQDENYLCSWIIRLCCFDCPRPAGNISGSMLTITC